MGTSIKQRVVECLEAHKGSFVSGAALAAELGVSRNAVWKAVRALEQEGYAIEGVPRKGYRLASACSVLSAASLARYLHAPGVVLEYHDTIDSTNTAAKSRAEAGAPHGTLVVADCQSGGRGRQGRPFFSPPASGVYFSLLLRPNFSIEDVTLITSFAAVCLAQAVDEVCGVVTQLKWVNDLFCDGHKVAGILTEASLDAESGSVAYVVVGIGVNVFDPKGGFPEGAGGAHSIMGAAIDTADLRARIVTGTVNRFMEGLPQVPECAHLEEYRRRSLLDGRCVHVYCGKEEFDAVVVGINDDFTLQVRLEGGAERSLSHGEVHIPSSQLKL